MVTTPTVTPDSPGTILAVDDNPANLGLLSEFLDSFGFQVLTARNGRAAVERAHYAQPDLILLDVMMPEMDGFEACQRLKTQPQTAHIPIIFMTALNEVTHKTQGFTLGAVDYITKPFQQEEVLMRIKTQLKLARLTQQVQAQNTILEQQVAQRTAELQQTLQDLKSAQVHLVQSEKMASLGLLVAGIAHEINNPVNFIHGNLGHVHEYVDNLLRAFELYQGLNPAMDEAIASELDDLDVAFIGEDLPKIVQSMAVGTERIREIVLGLRNFARKDDSQCRAVNVLDGIDSTLMLLHNRLKGSGPRPDIHITKDYGDLPLVHCYFSRLNQVWMNVLANAIDALRDAQAEISQPAIALKAQVINQDWVQIQITDNGPGIPEQCREQLFDPFFTTKPVGKGTGLGLSISYSIVVEQHHGRLTCTSQPGQGTTFTIELPIAPPPDSP
ncbi:response regulator [Spirulina major CS-329]|uniref:hybrid sensor histidine kinase/response regulator n=1 Tax=Spirulina TaxID=1154 RepID=UPI00232E711E|nr:MULTISPECIES: response regulator [Spirulina]MDB9493826.1 response regulator [Spirulina subsalsa CS-330]MDB9505408.1 response regulator [Spirulina major CS-329]